MTSVLINTLPSGERSSWMTANLHFYECCVFRLIEWHGTELKSLALHVILLRRGEKDEMVLGSNQHSIMGHLLGG